MPRGCLTLITRHWGEAETQTQSSPFWGHTKNCTTMAMLSPSDIQAVGTATGNSQGYCRPLCPRSCRWKEDICFQLAFAVVPSANACIRQYKKALKKGSGQALQAASNLLQPLTASPLHTEQERSDKRREF